MRWWWIVLVASGCDRVFPIEDDDVPPPCMPAPGEEAFDNGCAPWGWPTETSASVVSLSGGLVVTPTAEAISFGGCFGIEILPFELGGSTAVVSQTLAAGAPTAYTLFELFDTELPAALVLIAERDELIARSSTDGQVAEHGRIPYEAGHRLWRWRPTKRGSVAEVSADGFEWTRIGLAPGRPQRFRPQISAGTSSAEPEPGFARFESYNLCD